LHILFKYGSGTPIIPLLPKTVKVETFEGTLSAAAHFQKGFQEKNNLSINNGDIAKIFPN